MIAYGILEHLRLSKSQITVTQKNKLHICICYGKYLQGVTLGSLCSINYAWELKDFLKNYKQTAEKCKHAM